MLMLKTPFSFNAWLVSATLSLSSASIYAAGSGGHDAHVHGQASLTIAALGNQVLVELTSPAANLVGFENKAENKQQRETVEQAAQLLNQGTDLFQFNGMSCTLKEVEHNLQQVLLAQHDEHEDEHHEDESEHEDHHDDHDKHHDNESEHKDHHDDHDKHHDDESEHKDHHDESHQEVHSDIEAEYRFACSGKGPLESIEVKLPQYFSQIEKLATEWVTQSQQGAVNITAKNTTVVLR